MPNRLCSTQRLGTVGAGPPQELVGWHLRPSLPAVKAPTGAPARASSHSPSPAQQPSKAAKGLLSFLSPQHTDSCASSLARLSGTAGGGHLGGKADSGVCKRHPMLKVCEEHGAQPCLWCTKHRWIRHCCLCHPSGADNPLLETQTSACTWKYQPAYFLSLIVPRPPCSLLRCAILPS